MQITSQYVHCTGREIHFNNYNCIVLNLEIYLLFKLLLIIGAGNINVNNKKYKIHVHLNSSGQKPVGCTKKLLHMIFKTFNCLNKSNLESP